MRKTAFKNFEVIWSALADNITLSFFKGCLPQILLDPFFNTLSQMMCKRLFDNVDNKPKDESEFSKLVNYKIITITNRKQTHAVNL